MFNFFKSGVGESAGGGSGAIEVGQPSRLPHKDKHVFALHEGKVDGKPVSVFVAEDPSRSGGHFLTLISADSSDLANLTHLLVWLIDAVVTWPYVDLFL